VVISIIDDSAPALRIAISRLRLVVRASRGIGGPCSTTGLGSGDRFLLGKCRKTPPAPSRNHAPAAAGARTEGKRAAAVAHVLQTPEAMPARSALRSTPRARTRRRHRHPAREATAALLWVVLPTPARHAMLALRPRACRRHVPPARRQMLACPLQARTLAPSRLMRIHIVAATPSTDSRARARVPVPLSVQSFGKH
jgi:hypothetical protein